MLTRAYRLTSAEDYRRVVKHGRRAGSRTLVTHWSQHSDDPSPMRVGFIVGRQVGAAVLRNRVRRRLRELVRERLSSLPQTGQLVVRAQPASAAASYRELGADLDRSLQRLGLEPRPVSIQESA